MPAQVDLQPGPAGTQSARPADLLIEVDGRRVPVRVFDERRDQAPKPPSTHDAHHGKHVHGVVTAPMQGTILKVLVEKGQAIEAGDVIVEIAQEAVASADEFQAKIDKLKKDGRKSALLLVAGADGELRFVALSLQ